MAIGRFFESLTTTDWGALVAVLAVVIWWASRTQTRLNACDARLNACDESVAAIRTKLESIDANVNRVLGYLSAKESEPFKSASPVQLTDYGQRLLAGSNGAEIIKSYKDKVKIKNGMNEYQIQESCINFALIELETLLNADELSAVQATAFNEGIHIQTVLHVIGIELRDVIFKDRGLSVAHIDKHDPDTRSQSKDNALQS